MLADSEIQLTIKMNNSLNRMFILSITLLIGYQLEKLRTAPLPLGIGGIDVNRVRLVLIGHAASFRPP